MFDVALQVLFGFWHFSDIAPFKITGPSLLSYILDPQPRAFNNLNIRTAARPALVQTQCCRFENTDMNIEMVLVGQQ